MSLGKHPLDILPDVVWREVIKNLRSDDCRNCYFTCSYFERMLKPSIMCWNFKEVLPMILGKGEYFGFGEVRFRISKEDMLNCRLVCQAWHTAMDENLERLQETETQMQNFKIYFHNENQMDRLMTDVQRYNSLSCNKFLWKNLQFGVRTMIEEEEYVDPDPPVTEEALASYWEKGFRLLHRIGIKVMRARIDGIMEYTPAGGLQLTKVVRRYLTLMPNVKELNISNKQLEVLEWIDRFDQGINEIGGYLTNNPFPSLPHLRSLVMIENDGRFPLSLVNHLTTTYGPQIECVKAENYDKIPREYNFQMLRNLRTLEISLFGAEETLLNALNFLNNLNCPLETFKLYLEKIDPHEPLSVVKFLEKIKNLPIKDLDIQLTMSYEEWVPESIRLATTKSLHLRIDTIPPPLLLSPSKLSFDFLQCFPNLENFDFTLGADHELNFADEKSVRLNEHLNANGNLYRSNVWEVLPKLERFKYQVFGPLRDAYQHRQSVYSRQGYTRFNEVNPRERNEWSSKVQNLEFFSVSLLILHRISIVFRRNVAIIFSIFLTLIFLHAFVMS